MGKAAWIAAIVTIFSYYQNIGVMASTISGVPTPPKMVLIMDLSNRFVRTLCTLIESLPKIDIRWELVFVAALIPLLLDIVLIWFLCPKLRMFLHFIDTVVVLICCYCWGVIIFGDQSIVILIIFILTCIYLVLRYGIALYKEQSNDAKKPIQMPILAKELSDCLMSNLLTNCQDNYSIEPFNNTLAKFSDVINIIPSMPLPGVTIGMFICSLVLLFLSAWSVIAPPFLPDMPLYVSIWYPIIGFPVGTVTLVIAIMRCFESGRKAITRGKMMLRRYGNKILLTVLQLLYLPVITIMIDLLIPISAACDDGFYTHWTFDNESFIVPFINRTYECMPCTISSDMCTEMCYNAHEKRVMMQPGLRYLDDTLGPCCFLLIYTVLVFIIGIPLLFSVLISKNRAIVSNIVAYGVTVQDKWDRLMSRVGSSGVSIFSDFEWKHSKWPILQLVSKLIIMLLSVGYEVVSPYIILLYPVYYLMVTIALGICRPYRYRFNNILEIWTFFCLLLFSCVQIAILKGFMNIVSYETVLPIVFYILPFASLFSLIERKHQIYDEDPTFVTKEQHDMYRNKINGNYALKKPRTNQRSANDVITVSYSAIQSVMEQSTYEIESVKICNDDPIEFEQYYVSKSQFAKRIMKVYVLIDVIIDGYTTNLITRCLSAAITCSMIGVGFYIGASTTIPMPEHFVC